MVPIVSGQNFPIFFDHILGKATTSFWTFLTFNNILCLSNKIVSYAGKMEPSLEFRMQQEFLKECRWNFFFNLLGEKKEMQEDFFGLLGEKKV